MVDTNCDEILYAALQKFTCFMLYSAYVKFKYHTKAEASTKGFKIHINSYFKQGYVDDYTVPS